MHLLFDGGGEAFLSVLPRSRISAPFFHFVLEPRRVFFVRHLTAAVVFLHPST